MWINSFTSYAASVIDCISWAFHKWRGKPGLRLQMPTKWNADSPQVEETWPVTSSHLKLYSYPWDSNASTKNYSSPCVCVSTTQLWDNSWKCLKWAAKTLCNTNVNSFCLVSTWQHALIIRACVAQLWSSAELNESLGESDWLDSCTRAVQVLRAGLRCLLLRAQVAGGGAFCFLSLPKGNRAELCPCRHRAGPGCRKLITGFIKTWIDSFRPPCPSCFGRVHRRWLG